MFAELPSPLGSEAQLLRLALELGAAEVGGPLSAAERAALEEAGSEIAPSPAAVESARAAIRAGSDPLGDELCRIRHPQVRRKTGAFYTPSSIVEPMLDWVFSHRPARIVDAGCGSGRFAAAMARRDPDMEVLAIDVDPVATILTRAAMAALRARRTRVLQQDYTRLHIDRARGVTAFVGNPPYVRHHDLSPAQKAWATWAGKMLRCPVSGLSGLHVYFYLATALYARDGDIGCFVTSAEWLDVGYGSAVRDLLLNGLGVQALHVVDSRTAPFADAQSTAVIVCFEVGSKAEQVRVAQVESADSLRSLDLGTQVSRETLERSDRWTAAVKERRRAANHDRLVPLGSIARVHRGIVTGANGYFLLSRQRAVELGIDRWCVPAITDAREILTAGGVVRDTPERMRLLSVPKDVDRSAFPELDAYLRVGEVAGNGRTPISRRYICAHRRPWWFLGNHQPPPIIASYMARQAPAFVLNPDRLALVNVAHGVYPIEPLEGASLEKLVQILNRAREGFRGQGRTYQGGLEKYEPREMESLLIEWPDA